ncbi:glycine betaine ABC transporter substrate-binding protein [Staphylospora marina]|uniref:glycine betaine ABC transporter substrate-binding protein n=1 Tax=Staphylospora marina TaxID=2490858 RepID=UPI000F5BDF78|nr:glycine betaine ABC transporter substrate-binding protein [Staphylospora marina]
MKAKKAILLMLALVLAVPLVACGSADDDKIVVAGKNFTEQDILAHMMASLIEAKTDLKVERKTFLGGTQVVHNALINGSVDLYPEYTGTGWTATLKQKTITDPQEMYEKVKKAYEEKFSVVWLEPFGFNNTYTLTMRTDHAEKLGVETFSDLLKHAPNLVLGSTQEFLERPDGYKGLQETYGFRFKSAKGMDAGLTYGAVKEGAVDVIDGFSTDGRIPAFNLKILKDDKQFFPPYHAAPIIRQDTLKAHPELEQVLNLLAGKLDEKTMAMLNAQVDLEGKKARDVAENWLREQGLIQ